MMWIFVLADHKIHPTKKNRLQNLNEFGKEGRTWSWKRSLAAQSSAQDICYLCVCFTNLKIFMLHAHSNQVATQLLRQKQNSLDLSREKKVSIPFLWTPGRSTMHYNFMDVLIFPTKGVVFHPWNKPSNHWGEAFGCACEELVGPTRVPRTKQLSAMPTKRWYCCWLKTRTTKRTCKTLRTMG